MENEHQKYVVLEKMEEVPGVFTLLLAHEDKTIPLYQPGQYINVYFPDGSTPAGKAYSISSAPHEPVFTITVRNIGEFSGKLATLEPGEILHASLPYGFFRPEHKHTELVMLAAGIGVTPFRSIIRDTASVGFPRKISLFHSVRTSGDALFSEEFTLLYNKFENFSLKQFVTREEVPTLANATKGRIQVSEILNNLEKNADTEYLVCGSISFTRDMWKALKSHGVSEDFIYTEAFFSH